MTDIKIDFNGDIELMENGDIGITQSIRQAILIRLRWIFGEWRLGPEFGFQWFEEVFVKNPNTAKIQQLIREELLKIDGVKYAKVTSFIFDKASRRASFKYSCETDETTFSEEVTLYV